MRGAGTSLCIRFFDTHKTGDFLLLSFLFFLGGLDGNCHSSCSTSTQWSVSLWLKALILPFCFVFVDKYSVLRGVAGEGEKEREGESNTKWHLNISPFQVYNDCVNVSLRTKHRATCLTVCADWLPCLSSHSPPTHLSFQFPSLSPPPYRPPICLILSVTHPLLRLCPSSVRLPVRQFGFFLGGVLVLIFSLNLHEHKHTYMRMIHSTALFLSSLKPTHVHACTSHTHTRHRQMAHLPGKLPIPVLTTPASTPLPWVVKPRTRPPTLPTPLPLQPPITSPQHAVTFPAPWLSSTLSNPQTPPSSPPKWEWQPSPPHLQPQGYIYNRRFKNIYIIGY